MTAYDDLLKSGQYEENPEVPCMPIEALIHDWHQHKRLIEPAQRQLYETIAGQIRGLHVCDVGCGSGLGSLILAQEAEAVVGVEIVKDAVRFAEQCFSARNLVFILSNIIEWDPPIPFDIVVAIEMIEHIVDYHAALANMLKILSDNGALYVSSPNRNTPTALPNKPRNAHHVREWTAQEFQEILSLYFGDVKLYDRALIPQEPDTILTPILAVCSK